VRKYYDDEGNEVGTSRGCQGGCAQTLLVAIIVLFLIGLIISAAGH
jgi:hypothetical protein